MKQVHLCLSDLLDQDLSANEYFQTLSPRIQSALYQLEITTFEELQSEANHLKQQNRR